MKLYYHPVSTTSRPIVLFAAESGIDLDYEVVDLFTGEHYQPPFEAINPNHLVPVLEDGDFRLTESSAILKYLADKTDSPRYPKDLKQRARINERMDWVNTQLCRELNETKTPFPGSRLQLHFCIKPEPPPSLAFPGPRPTNLAPDHP